VVIESPRGKVRQRAKLFGGIHPGVVGAQHAWWYPEMKESGHGWAESNINVLTRICRVLRPGDGRQHAHLLCKIYRDPDQRAPAERRRQHEPACLIIDHDLGLHGLRRLQAEGVAPGPVHPRRRGGARAQRQALPPISSMP
jgi:hypothetical protein